jgi:Putative rhamnosyl transferase
MTDSRDDLEKVRADMPPLLILTRFGLGVRDVAWLEHRATLVSSITAPSLFAQDDQSFRWVLLVDEDPPSDSPRSPIASLLSRLDTAGWGSS